MYTDFVKPLSRKAQGILKLKKKKKKITIDCNQKKNT